MRAWLVPFLLGAACATTSPFTQQQLADSQTAIAIAERAGAAGDPKAAPYLELALYRMRDADRALSLRHYSDATVQLRRAQADANLATALARETRALTMRKGARP